MPKMTHAEKQARKLSILLLITADKAIECGCTDADSFAELAKKAFEGAVADAAEADAGDF